MVLLLGHKTSSFVGMSRIPHALNSSEPSCSNMRSEYWGGTGQNPMEDITPLAPYLGRASGEVSGCLWGLVGGLLWSSWELETGRTCCRSSLGFSTLHRVRNYQFHPNTLATPCPLRLDLPPKRKQFTRTADGFHVNDNMGCSQN